MEVIRPGIAIEVTKESDGWHGRAYKKVGKKWFSSAVITPRETETAARKAVIAIAK